jgi:hypothetical protein
MLGKSIKKISVIAFATFLISIFGMVYGAIGYSVFGDNHGRFLPSDFKKIDGEVKFTIAGNILTEAGEPVCGFKEWDLIPYKTIKDESKPTAYVCNAWWIDNIAGFLHELMPGKGDFAEVNYSKYSIDE